MSILLLRRFKRVMRRVLQTNDTSLRKSWINRTAYTNVWSNRRTGIYKSIAQGIDMQGQLEYWDVDVVYFKEKCPLVESDRAKVLSVAMEHENNPDTSYNEINRLLTCTALLKVLVTYPDDIQQGHDLLRGYTKQIKAVDKVILNFSVRQPIMVVFGYKMGAGQPLRWRYRVYDPIEGFKVLN